MDWKSKKPGDPELINKIVEEYMSQGKFDQLRRQLLSEVDTKSSYQNVKQRMETTVRSFLENQRWRPDLNKNQLRDSLKRQILTAPFLRPGVARIVDQLANRMAMKGVRPDLEAVTKDLLGMKDEPQPMETASESTNEESKESIVKMEESSVVDHQVVNGSAADIKLEQSDSNSQEEKPIESLTGAMVDLTIPKSEVSSTLVDGTTVDSQVPMKEDEEDSVEPMVIDSEVADERADSADESDHSITNQMSPISAGNPSPPPSPVPPVSTDTDPTPGSSSSNIKRAADFVGKIPKLRKDPEPTNVSSLENKNSSSPRKHIESERKRDRSRDRDKKSSGDRRERDRPRKDSKSDRSRQDSSKDKESSRSRESSSHRDRKRDSERERSNQSRERYRDKYKSSSRSKEKSSEDRSRRSEKEKNKESEKSDLSSKYSKSEIKDDKENSEIVKSVGDEKKEEEVTFEEMKETEVVEPKKDDKISDDESQASVESEGPPKTPDGSSQDSLTQDGDNPKIESARVFKISPMVTRNRGVRKTIVNKSDFTPVRSASRKNSTQKKKR